MAGAAVTLADEDPESAPRRFGIILHRSRVAARERIAVIIERRAPGDQRLLEGGQRLPERDEDLVVLLRHCAESALETAGKACVAAHERSGLRDAAAHFARVQDGPEALRPERV